MSRGSSIVITLSKSSLYSLYFKNKKPRNVEISRFLRGGAYEARSHTHILKGLKNEEVEHTIAFHLTTHLTTLVISERASSFWLVRIFNRSDSV